MATNAYYSCPKILLRLHEGPLGVHIDIYAAKLLEEGHCQQSAWRSLRVVCDFSHWLARKRLALQDVLAQKANLHCISLDKADSIGFMENLPTLEFFFCKKVLDRNGKSYFYSITDEQDMMTPQGIQVSYEPTCDQFYQPLKGT